MVKTIVALAALIVMFPNSAAADSDGYYCIGKGYVAYETRLSNWPAGHFLHIIRVAHRSGISEQAPIPLEEFQVHGMTCRDTEVVLQGWAKRYSVQLSGGGAPAVKATSVSLAQSPTLEPQNLGMLAKVGVTDIPSDGVDGEFQIVVAQTSRPMKRTTEYYTVTQILQRTTPAQGLRVVASLTLLNLISSQGGELSDLSPDPPRRSKPEPPQARSCSIYELP
jgi:hypothetical protein